jgi:phage shock protein A
MAGLQDKSAFRAFDQMVEKIEDTERKALASAEVTEDLTGDDLSREFSLLESDSDEDVEDRLLALKRDMGLLAPASSAAPKALEAGDDDLEVDDVDDVEAVEIGEADDETS